jgi:hypothetical protein
MTLTVKQIYERYSVRDFCRVIEVKRLNSDGATYEAEWQDIEKLSKLKILDESVKSISNKIANNNYAFGIVGTGNVTLNLDSKNGQFDEETNTISIFFGYTRHRSLIRIRDGFVDNYTDPINPVNVYSTVFEGFIDVTATGTKVDDENLKQNLVCINTLSFLLKNYTISDMGILTATTVETLIYEILNRSEFTSFFTVSAVNINAGYDITSFDISQYEGQTQLFTLFEEFSIGHSFFYVKDGIFYYRPIASGLTNVITITNKKLEKFSSYNSGISNVFERLYWQDQPSITFASATNKYNRSKTIDVKGCTDNTQRQNLLDNIGATVKIQRKEFTIAIPYYMNIYVMDIVTVQTPQIIPEDAFIWGISKWGEGKKWRKSFQADNIPNNLGWLVRSVKHSNFKTQLVLQEII